MMSHLEVACRVQKLPAYSALQHGLLAAQFVAGWGFVARFMGAEVFAQVSRTRESLAALGACERIDIPVGL